MLPENSLPSPATKRNTMTPKFFHRSINLILLFLLLFFLGCSENPLTFQLRFPQVSGLKANAPVYFDKNEIGQVTKVFYTKEGDYLVEVAIDPGFKNAATENSRFYIEPAPVQGLPLAVIVEQQQPGGLVLQNGTIVQGSVRNDYLSKMFSDLQKKAGEAQIQLNKTLEKLKKSFDANSGKLDRQLETTLEDLTARFNAYTKELGKLPDSREVKELEESFQQFAEEFQKAGKDIQDRLRYEIIPQLRMELEQLRDRLKNKDRDKELEKIDKDMQKLDMV